MIEYKLKNGDILKDGHTMFLEDVVRDLNRKAFLESEFVKLKRLPDTNEIVPEGQSIPTTSHILNEAFDYINKTGLAAHVGISGDELMAILKTLQLETESEEPCQN